MFCPNFVSEASSIQLKIKSDCSSLVKQAGALLPPSYRAPVPGLVSGTAARHRLPALPRAPTPALTSLPPALATSLLASLLYRHTQLS